MVGIGKQNGNIKPQGKQITFFAKSTSVHDLAVQRVLSQCPIRFIVGLYVIEQARTHGLFDVLKQRGNGYFPKSQKPAFRYAIILRQCSAGREQIDVRSVSGHDFGPQLF